MKKILVAGGAGFIGSHLCERLLKDNYQVICVDNFITGQKENIAHLISNKNFTLTEHNVIKPLDPKVKIDALFHLASPASPNHHSSLSYHALPMETMMVNTVGTIELLKLAKKNNAKFLFASSSEVYGDPLVNPQKEDYLGNVSAIGPRSVYDEAKRFGETIVFHFLRHENVDARVARIFNTYGPRLSEADMRMIVAFINQALAGKPITIYGDGSQTRSLCFVADMIEGLMRLMFYPDTKGQVVNLGATGEHTVMEYAKLTKSITKSKSPIVMSEDLPEDDPKKRRPDISLAKNLLKWQPKVALEDGLAISISYFKERFNL